LNARNPFTEGLHAPGTPEPKNRGVPPFRWNQFGFAAGAPIRKNKTFAFGDYQGTRQRIGGTTFATVPTLRMRSGDLSELRDSNGNLIPIFDPLTGNPDGTGRQRFDGNIIPTSRISPVARNLLNLLPPPTFTDRVENNYVASGSSKFDTNQFGVRVDHYLTDATRFFVRYNYFGSDIFIPGVYGIEAGGPPIMPGVGAFSKGRNQNVAINLNHVFTPNLLIDFRYGYSRYRVNVLQPDVGMDTATRVGIPNINFGGTDTSGLSNIIVEGTAGFSMGGGVACNCPLDQIENTHQWASNLSWTKGSHTTKWGVDVRRFWNFRRPSDISRRGRFFFRPAVTGAAGVSGSGAGVASLLLGLPSSFDRIWSQGRNDEFENHLFFYGQDQWKITPKLTLNYGLRYEIYTPPAARTAEGSNFDFATGLVRIAGLGEISRTTGIQTDKNNLAPRIGLAYLLTPKTVIRAGVGRSYFPNWFAITISGQNFPFVSIQTISPQTTFSPIFNIAQGPPLFTFPPLPSNGLLPLPDGISIIGIPFDRTTAYSDGWNLMIQRQLTPNLALEVGYVGNVGRQLSSNPNLNQAIPGPGPLNPRRPFFQKFGLTQRLTNRCNCSSSNYNAFQAKVEQRLSHGLSFIASYTWSKTIDFGTTDAFNRNNDRALASFERTHVFSLGHILELPFGPGKPLLSGVSGPLRHVVEGWKFTGVTRVQSGLPFTVTLSNNAPLNADFTLRPDLVGDPDVSDPSRNQWFNPRAFAVPGPFRQGTAGRNILRGPNFISADWALFKDFRLTEKTQLEFRWETFNAFNNTNLANPASQSDTPSAGQIFGLCSGCSMRQMQFGLKLLW
jgi:TonB dependent receptor